MSRDANVTAWVGGEKGLAMSRRSEVSLGHIADRLAFRYGTAKSGVGISAMAVLRPDLMMKCTVPVIMAGIIAIVSQIQAPIRSVHHTDALRALVRFGCRRPDLW